MIDKNKYDYWNEEDVIEEIIRKSLCNIKELKKIIVPDDISQENYNKQIEDLENIIYDVKDECNSLNDLLQENQSELEELKYEIENGNADYVIGNYDELKRRMEINGFWNDDIEFFFENLVRFSNKL